MVSAMVVGLGAMGLRHAESLNVLGIEVVAGVDPAPEAIVRAQDSAWFSKSRFFASVDEALSHTVPNVLTIASTAPAHAGAVESGITAGIRTILVEKPLTVSLSIAESLRRLSDENGVSIAVNHQSRFLDRYAHVWNMNGTEEFGDLRSMSVFGADFGAAMNGIHFIEIFEWLCGERISEVVGDLSPSHHPNPRGAAFLDYEGVLIAWTPSERRLHIDCSHDMGHGISLAFGFERGKIVWDELTGRGVGCYRRPEDVALPSYRYGTPSSVSSFDFPVEDLVEGTSRVVSALLRGANYPTLQDGQSAMVALVGGIASSESGSKRINIRDLPTDRVFGWA